MTVATWEDEIAEADEGLTERERRFCDCYAGDAMGNGVKACQMAGFNGSYGVLANYAWRLLKRPHIKKALEARLEADPHVPGRVERLRRLGSIARGEVPEWKMTAAGEVVKMPTSPQAMMQAIKQLSDVSGETVQKVALTNSAGEDIQGVPLSELLQLRNG